MPVFVISKNGERLMPTFRYRHVRRLLKEGKAHICCRKPFAIQLDYDTSSYTQPTELCMDSGYQHIGVSVKTDKQELAAVQYDLLKDEKQRHDNQRRYRRDKRNRLRYRKSRFNNCKSTKKEGWIAPSLQNKADRHVDIVASFIKVAPITDVYFEGGQFDTQALAAIQAGNPLPEGVDYQHGDQYGKSTLREAVFYRDHYTCRICGKNSFKDGAILRTHHLYFWMGQRGNRLSELITICTNCHTSANHQPGGKLFRLDLKLPPLKQAAFMNTVKWYIYNRLKSLPCNVYLTYGAATKSARIDLKLEKSHLNDAYAIGKLHPPIRVKEALYQKRRRNNRCLEKFYDSKFLDIRTGKAASGKELSCNCTNRSESRVSEKSFRQYRGEKISKGRRSIRKQRYPIQPGDVLLYNNEKVIAKGTQCCGKSIKLSNGKNIAPTKLQLICHVGGWQKVS